MRETWYFPQVIRVRLELTTNGLKDHCYDVLTSDINGLTETPVEVCPSIVSHFQFTTFLSCLFMMEKSFSNRLKLNFAYISVVINR